MVKRIFILLFIATLILSLSSGCAAFENFNPNYVRELRRDLKAEYEGFESLQMKIGYGQTLVIDCRLDENTPSDEAGEIYRRLTELLCSRELVEGFLDAVGAPYGYDAPQEPHESVDFAPQYSLNFYLGKNRNLTDFSFTSYETVYSHGYEHKAYVYRGFPGWPEQ